MICWDNVLVFMALLLAWILVTVWFPSVCLGSLLGKIRFSERVLFYQIISVLYCTGITFILGYLHIYSEFTIVCCYFLLPLIICGIIKRKRVIQVWCTIGNVLSDLFQNRYGFKLLMYHMIKKIKSKLHKWDKEAQKRGKTEIILLGIILLGVAVYFGTYKFTHYAYATSDEEVHLYWIQSLLSNKILPAGLYPHSLHSILALLSVVLPFSEVRVFLNFSTLLMVIIVFAFYVLMRKIQRGKYTALLATAMYLVLGCFAVIVYSRFQYTLPMEFGLIAVPAVIIAILNLLSDKTRINKVLFMLAISYTISAHFYAGILAAMVCVGFGVVYFRSFIKKKILWTILGLGIGGIVISALPFGVGLLAGHEFQGSMGWAMNVITGEEDEATVPVKYQNLEIEYWVEADGTIRAVYAKPDKNDSSAQGLTEIEVEALGYQGDGVRIDEKEFKLRLLITGLRSGIIDCFKNMTGCYIVLGSALLVLLLGIFGLIKSKACKTYFRFAVASAVSFFVFLVFICLPRMDLPEIIAADRINGLQYLWYPILLFFLFEILTIYWKKDVTKRIATEMVLCGSLAGLLVTDNVARDRYVYSISNEETAGVCYKIRENCEEKNYTIVSTTNEISLVRNHGYHVEWIDFFIEQMDAKPGEIYTIPTKDIYFIIEKELLSYGEVGYEKDGWITKSNDYISKEYAAMDIEEKYLDREDALRNAVYKKQRNVIMSKAYYWAEEYEEYYGEEFRKVYETDNLIIYHLTQNPYALHNLLLNQ